MIQLKWFRIETGADGSILSCQEVDAKARGGAVVRYYEAVSASEACDAAKEWAKRKKESSARHKEKRALAGMCDTGGCRWPRREGRTICQYCADKSAERVAKLRAGLCGPRKKYPSIEAAHAASIRQCADGKRKRGGVVCVYLRRNLRQLDTLGPVAFRAWLVSEINKRSDAAHQIPTEEAQAAE